jgi:hypothetical protein
MAPGEGSKKNPLQSQQESITELTETPIEEQVDQLQGTVQRIERYRELQQEYERFRTEIGPRGDKTPSSSGKSRSREEIKPKNIPLEMYVEGLRAISVFAVD